jgi:hypothetical protein
VVDDRAAQAPAVGSERLDVRHDAANPGAFGDGDDLVHRRHDADVVVAFVANVAGVDAARLAREGDHLVDLRVSTGRVEQAARQAEGAVRDRLGDDRAHPRQFVGGRLTIAAADDVSADAGVTDQHRGVDADPAVGLERGPLGREVGRTAAVRVPDHRRHALRHEPARVAQRRTRQGLERVRVRVDEAGRDDAIARVDDESRGRSRQRAGRRDDRDAIAADADVRAAPRVARPVEHAAVRDHDVDRLLLRDGGRPAAEGQQRERHRQQWGQILPFTIAVRTMTKMYAKRHGGHRIRPTSGSVARPRLVPHDLGHFDRVLGVPLLASQALREPVPLVLAPRAQRLVALPFHDRQPFAVVSGVVFEVDEAGHGLRGREHLGRHVRIAGASIGPHTGAEQNHQHGDIVSDRTLAPGSEESDWTILFTHWGVLNQDLTIAAWTRGIGEIGMLASVGWLAWMHLCQDEPDGRTDV